MEKRKVTTLGKYSFIITLPKDWVRMHNINSGDSVYVDILWDGSLNVNPTLNGQKESKETSMHIHQEEEVNSIIRKVIGCYLNGFSIIYLTSASSFTSKQQNAVRQVVKSLYMRILESTSSRITLQTLMDESLASVVSGIERMHIITSSMSQDILKAMREWNVDLAQSVITLEDDVDQFKFFLLRLLRNSLENPSLAVKLGLSMSDCFDYQLLINRIEYVADHLTEIAGAIINMKDKYSEIPAQVFTSLIQHAELCFHHYDLAVDSFFSGTLDNTNEIIDYKDSFESYDGVKYIHNILHQDLNLIIQLYMISDNISKINKFNADIAELTIDRSFKRI